MEANSLVPLAKVMDLLLDAICVVDEHGHFIFASAAVERIFGYTPEEIIGKPMIDLVHPDDRERTLQAAAQIMAGRPNPHFQNRYVRKDGQTVHIMWSALWSEADRVRIAVARDITELKHAELMQAALHGISEAAHATEDLQSLFLRIHQIIGDLLPANNFFVALYDEESDELSFPYFVDAYDESPAARKLDSGTLSALVIRSGEALLVTPDTPAELPPEVGSIVGRESLDWLGVPLHSQQGVIGALVVQSYSGDLRYTEKDKALLQFVSTQVAAAIERKKTQTRLVHLARHDQLTSLPNRTLFDMRLHDALSGARRDDQRLSVLYLDLDNFKPVNDSFGHDAGDRLLREIARRIRSCVRESDTIGRIGGDEFAVLLNNAGRPECNAVAEAIRAEINQPFDFTGGPLRVSASIGIATHPEHGDSGDSLMQHADDAMYVAKREGGNRVSMAVVAGRPDAGDPPGDTSAKSPRPRA